MICLCLLCGKKERKMEFKKKSIINDVIKLIILVKSIVNH